MAIRAVQEDHRKMSPGPRPLPVTCPIGWQPNPLAPVFHGARSLGTNEGAPVPLRVWFPSLDGSVESAPIMEGCGRYPLVLFCHGHCPGDSENYRAWSLIPSLLARAGYVVVVPHLVGNTGGNNPSVSSHPDEATLDRVLDWARDGWEHADCLMPPPATAVIGHSFGAMLGARFAVGREVSAYAGLSGGWLDWFGDAPFPLPLLDVPTLLLWGGASDFFAHLPDATWQSMHLPRHRVVYTEGEHWDYLGNHVTVPCRRSPGPCRHTAGATGDLLSMFLGRYLPPECATTVAGRIPQSLAPPLPLTLAADQEFYAGLWLIHFDALGGDASCGVDVSVEPAPLVANSRTRETHSLDHPCEWVSAIANGNRRFVTDKPSGYHWCDYCFPALADG